MTLIKHALILEDDPIASVLIRLTMEESGLVEHLTVLPNGREGIKHIQSKAAEASYPDLIILDLNMPFMNGFDFLTILESELNGVEIPVFILTSSIDAEDRAKADTFKCVKGFIVKPLKKFKLNTIEQWFKMNVDNL